MNNAMRKELAANEIEDISFKQKVRAIAIEQWAIMARAGAGLGYGKCTLSDGVGEPPLSEEEFTNIHNAIYSLPLITRLIIIARYKSEKPVHEIALSTRTNASHINLRIKQGVDMLYGMLCLSSKQFSRKAG